MNYWTQSPKNIYVAAHRGWSSAYPENTMEAFRSAIALGVDQIETDVRITRDGELVLIHDKTVDRTTDGTGLVCEMTLAQLRALDAGKVLGMEGQGYRIPTLSEFMELVKDHPALTVDFELKEYPEAGHEAVAYEVCDRVLRLIDAYGMTDRCVINTFSGRLHEYIQKTYGNRYRQHVYFPQSHLGECTADPYAYAYCCCMFGDRQFGGMAAKEEFNAMIARGVQPWAGAGVKDAATVDMAIERGAYLITCNNPDEILRLLRQRGRRTDVGECI